MKIKINVTKVKLAKREVIKNDYKLMLEDATSRVWVQGTVDQYMTGKSFITFEEL